MKLYLAGVGVEEVEESKMAARMGMTYRRMVSFHYKGGVKLIIAHAKEIKGEDKKGSSTEST